ncbi:alkaline phosphatase family protein [Trinickia sp. NRRL B-1857]|uniref:alkaline phosphatase family protein n=1 Tax=Trinickia sp. NRRL B-1857 TaxID=3162879 RepID=UPI003D27D3C6
MELLFDHVVVLMLENRSFDHLFGYLGKGEGLPDGGATNYLTPGDPTSTAFHSRRGGDFTAVGQGPSHSLKQTNEQLFGTTHEPASGTAGEPMLDGFVSSFRTSLKFDLKREPTESELQQVMNCFDPVQLPVLSTLARNFVLCDRWFADVPGPTMPNRAFVHAATSQGYTDNASWKPAFTCDTLYDRLNAAKKAWRIYYHDSNDVLELYPNVEKKVGDNVLFEGNFLSDVASDNLATYSFIVPAFMGSPEQPVNSMHAPADVRPAEKLAADVYTALQAHEDVWKKTLFILLFDEHGGYYDHVKPPKTVSPDGIAGRTDQPFLVPFDFQRLGLRVPCILISPWFAPAVDSTVYSHSTIPGSMIEAFGLGSFLTKRDANAAKLTQTYLAKNATRQWRTDTPHVTVPVQPTAIDAMQRELLDGSVYLDPHPENRNALRTRDIQDPQHARQFVRTQVAKHLEHYFASGGNSESAGRLSADNQPATPSVSASRIDELRSSKGKPTEPAIRP